MKKVNFLPPEEIFPAFLSSADFFEINFFGKFFTGIQAECKIVWIQIRPDILSGLIWVQTICKIYQQTTFGDKGLTGCLIDSFLFCLQDVMKKQKRRKISAKVAILQMYVSIENDGDRQNFGA